MYRCETKTGGKQKQRYKVHRTLITSAWQIDNACSFCQFKVPMRPSYQLCSRGSVLLPDVPVQLLEIWEERTPCLLKPSFRSISANTLLTVRDAREAIIRLHGTAWPAIASSLLLMPKFFLLSGRGVVVPGLPRQGLRWNRGGPEEHQRRWCDSSRVRRFPGGGSAEVAGAARPHRHRRPRPGIYSQMPPWVEMCESRGWVRAARVEGSRAGGRQTHVRGWKWRTRFFLLFIIFSSRDRSLTYQKGWNISMQNI
jgi:hypothetical protein